ncbi:MAG: hypothetical protein RBG13Loki_3321 [Promethearchaeota archaeon CR_4]|nr:MAG: hypothetical protein RBG13Loki_3321 [Candidatus Lokiarchaeota archaeon CR_4]
MQVLSCRDKSCQSGGALANLCSLGVGFAVIARWHTFWLRKKPIVRHWGYDLQNSRAVAFTNARAVIARQAPKAPSVLDRKA